MSCGECGKNVANESKYTDIEDFVETHKDQPEVIKGYLQGHIESNRSLTLFLQEVLKVEKGTLSDSSLPGLLAGAVYIQTYCEDLLANL